MLVLASALAHSGWNFLTKRANNPEIFTWWSAVIANVVLAPMALWFLLRNPPSKTGWIFMASTWSIHLAYLTALSRAYRHADLSLVYPVARGTGLALIPIFGVLLLAESVAPAAMVGVALILAGIFAVSVGGLLGEGLNPLALLHGRGIQYALLTGVLISAYSIIDKRGVAHVTPLLYMYFVTSAASIGMPFLVFRGHPGRAIVAEFKVNAPALIFSSMLQFASYALVLTALQVSKVSYVAPVREVGIVIGVLLGAIVLNEPFKRGRIIGALMILGGAAVVALSP